MAQHRANENRRGRNQAKYREGSHSWINQQIVDAANHGDVQHLMSIIGWHLPAMNLVNLSTAIHRMAKLAGSSHQSLSKIQQQPEVQLLLEQVYHELEPMDAGMVQCQTISNVLWSMATIRKNHKRLLTSLARIAASNLAEFKAFELSTTLWALAKLSSPEIGTHSEVSRMFDLASRHIQANMKDFNFRCLATVAWAFATNRHADSKLFRSISERVKPLAGTANCQEIANTVWAFGTAGVHDTSFFSVLADVATSNIEEFKPQEISNTLWGFATNGFFHETFFAKAAWALQEMHAGRLESQHLANVLWSFSRVQPKALLTHCTILGLLPLCTVQLHTFKPQELSSTLLAVAKAFGKESCSDDGVHPNVLTFFRSCADRATLQLEDFSSMSLANILHACALVPMACFDHLVGSLTSEILRRYPSFDASSKVHLLKSYMLLSSHDNSLPLSMIANDVAFELESVKPQELQTLSRLLSTGMATHGRKAAGRVLNMEEICGCLQYVAKQARLHSESNTASKPQSPLCTSNEPVKMDLYAMTNATIAPCGSYASTWQSGQMGIMQSHDGLRAMQYARMPQEPPAGRLGFQLRDQVQQMLEEESALESAKARVAMHCNLQEPTQRLILKNSFLHAEDSDDAEDNTSCRASSVPRSMGTVSTRSTSSGLRSIRPGSMLGAMKHGQCLDKEWLQRTA